MSPPPGETIQVESAADVPAFEAMRAAWTKPDADRAGVAETLFQALSRAWSRLPRHAADDERRRLIAALKGRRA